LKSLRNTPTLQRDITFGIGRQNVVIALSRNRRLNAGRPLDVFFWRPAQSGTSMAKKSETNAAPPGNATLPQSDYAALSLRDLLDARDQYHIHLMRYPNVVATAVGYYRIRNEDSWPGAKPVIKGEGPRRLDNSSVRAYSWPAVLVFVEKWADAAELAAGRRLNADKMVPSTLYLPDGRRRRRPCAIP
jgi:hypothetical protein